MIDLSKLETKKISLRNVKYITKTFKALDLDLEALVDDVVLAVKEQFADKNKSVEDAVTEADKNPIQSLSVYGKVAAKLVKQLINKFDEAENEIVELIVNFTNLTAEQALDLDVEELIAVFKKILSADNFKFFTSLAK